MTDEARLPDPAPLIPHLPPSSALIVRDRDPARAADTAAGLLDPCRAAGVLLLVSSPTPPAALTGDGVHIPEQALARWRRVDLMRLQPALVTASAHGMRAVCRARNLGADAALLGSVFETASHPGGRGLGLYRFAAIVRGQPLPVFALGGVTAHQCRRIERTGAAGVAGIGLFA